MKDTQTNKKIKKEQISDNDIAYMSGLSQAALEKPTFKSQLIVWVILLVVIWLIVWANYAELDKIVRGDGRVVPATSVQIVQNLEGGIIEDILVRSGDLVKQGEVLIRLDNTQFAGIFGEAIAEQNSLIAKSVRLHAEAKNTSFKMPETFESQELEEIFKREYTLYRNHMIRLATSEKIIKQQIVQSNTELKDAFSQRKQLQKSFDLLRKEVNVMKPLVKQGIASQVDLLQIQREKNDTFGKLQAVKHSIPKFQSIIKESEHKIKEATQKFQNESQEQLNQVLAQILQIEQSRTSLEDKVRRTSITSPVTGVISELLVSSIGEVIQPGSDLARIIPEDDSLVLETKILPSDIGFIHTGLNAKIKFTAYDFAIHGGLEGTVERISADTITDEEGNSFFIARIKTHEKHLGTKENPLYLMPGMTATVDIIVGQHSVLDYLVKPIIKARDVALRES